jgi:anti-sigma factor RsiW
LIEHLTQNQVEDYCRRQLRPDELLSVSDHLGECEKCRRRTESALNGDAAFFAVRAEVFGEAAEISSPHLIRAHPTAEQTAGFIDGKLATEELQSVADHLTNCEQCALVVDDLRSFRDQIAPSLAREYHPTPVISPVKEGWWNRTVASIPALFGRSQRLAFGGALMVLLLALAGWFIWRAQPESVAPQQTVIPPAPQPQDTPPTQPDPAPLIAQLNDGPGQLALDREGRLSGADDLPPAYQSMLKEALTNPQIKASSQLNGLTRPGSAPRSPEEQKSEFFVIEPVGKVLITDRPTFRWTHLAGATGYIVEVYDGEFNLLHTSPQLTANSWAPQSLARGRVYGWQVKAIKDGQEVTSPRPPSPQARFRILDQRRANELAKARRSYATSHLVLGLLYAEAGLLSEAEQHLRLLQKANPESEIARKLLTQIQALRR